jgi:hypothetical protein
MPVTTIGLGRYDQFIFTVDEIGGSTPAPVTDAVEVNISLKNKLIEGEQGGVDGMARQYNHTDAEISINTPVPLTSTANLAFLGDCIITIGGKTVALHKSASLNLSQKIVESEVSGAINPFRDYGRRDVSISIDSAVKLKQVDAATPTIESVNEFHNVLAAAAANRTEVAVTYTGALLECTGQFLVEEITGQGKDGGHTGANYKLVPNGFPTLTASSDITAAWIIFLVNAFISKEKFLGTAVTGTMTMSGTFLVESLEDKADDGKPNEGSFKVVPDGVLTVAALSVSA